MLCDLAPVSRRGSGIHGAVRMQILQKMQHQYAERRLGETVIWLIESLCVKSGLAYEIIKVAPSAPATHTHTGRARVVFRGQAVVLSEQCSAEPDDGSQG